MTGIRTSHTAPRVAAVFVRLTAFVVAAISAIVIPCDLAAAAVGHVATGTAVAIASVMSALTFAIILLARGVDPLRH